MGLDCIGNRKRLVAGKDQRDRVIGVAAIVQREPLMQLCRPGLARRRFGRADGL
ncbi:hypothetical protein C8K38_11673 [Rhodococcus sp. OK611]|nr:hypothetical protein C8K38_11673 [Rhodococcus sp. OK611]SNX92811.1 hypothetical protein SAMN05447004_11673 [Rhodococcus sp. OK270]